MLNLRVHQWQRRVSGSTVYLVAPEGAAAGVITMTERVRPVVSLAELTAGADEILAPPVLVTNNEGEQGAFVSVRVGSATRDIGVLVGDEFLATIVGFTEDPTHAERTAAAVRDLLERFPLLLGVRRRLYLYPPPPSWRAIARGLEAEYYAPTFPADPSRLTVFPALPSEGVNATDAVATLVAGQTELRSDTDAASWHETTRSTPSGLLFQCVASRDSERHVALAAAVDDRYLYAMRLESTPAVNHLPLFEATMDGVVPIVVGKPPSLAALAHWVD